MTTDEAIAFLRAWREDDERLPIPGTKWGLQLAEAIDTVIGAADAGR